MNKLIFTGFSSVLMLAAMLFMAGCSKDKDDNDNTFNIFSVNDDIALGIQLKQEIEAHPGDYPVLDSTQYKNAYDHIYRMRDAILATNLLTYEDKFDWEVKIIHNDSVLNAFCAPGGFIYFYTGLIRFLDNEAQCAGVLGHEMAHADRRHSTDQLTKAYGLQLLFSIVLGNNPAQITEIVAGLAAGVASLAFSRNAEYEADEYSVKYLYQTEYDARGVGGFFLKLDSSPQPPEFLSTHPHPDNRYDKINEVWQGLGGKEGELFAERYQEFINSLP
ncbi:MAG: M48 family metalloprotease [Bacteroidales bacterium]|nr:M48 family metalloprotease [Bacteroidales bacterium]